jgi:hypothetical protein
MRLALPWVRSAGFDTGLILSPAFAVTACVLMFPVAAGRAAPIGTGLWLLLIVGLDVAHVYSTLFRTYLDRRERAAHGALLTFVPLFCWLLATGLHALSAALFWTVLAYTAVFHFVRQQYGLMMLYALPADRVGRTRRWLDGAMIAAATGYPLIYWHASLPRSFAWFIDGDFIALPAVAEPLARGAYAAITAAYLAANAFRWWRGEPCNVPRQAIVLGTALSWYVGIVAFDGDLAFTATNVVAHAIPYMALVWLYGENRERRIRPRRRLFSPAWVPAMLALVVGLAYLEEGLWDGFVWREHLGAFAAFRHLPTLAGPWLNLAVPLLILPQLTHYVLDGFIWRLRHDRIWLDTLLWRRREARA